MPTLIESGSVPVSIRDVARLSQSLADDLQRLIPRTEGYTVEEYLSLNGNYKVEYVEGRLQILPMPTAIHQKLVTWLFRLLEDFLRARPEADVQIAPFKVMLNSVLYREPDLCVMTHATPERCTNEYWVGADLVIEVLSPSNADHDWKTKRVDYAVAGIAEYWAVDAQSKSVTQFALIEGKGAYENVGTSGVGGTIASRAVQGFVLDVAAMFSAVARFMPAD